MAGMDLSPAEVETALRKTRAAWRSLWPDRDEDEMPEALRSAAEYGKERGAMFSALEAIRPRPGQLKPVAQVLSEVEGLARDLGMPLVTPAMVSNRAAELGLKPGDIVYELPIERARELARYRRTVPGPVATNEPGKESGKETSMVATVKDRDQVFAEIKAASAALPGDTEPQRIAAFIEAHPERYAEYQDAPLPARTPERAPAPPTLAAAELSLRANPQSREAAWGVIAAKAEALATSSGITFAEAVSQIAAREPDLADAYSAAYAAGA